MSSHATKTSAANAQIILNVAKVIGAYLEMSEVLAALNETLKPIIHFDAVTVGVIEGDMARVYSGHIEGMQRNPGESLASFAKRHAPEVHSPLKFPVSETPVSQMTFHKPYVAEDVKTQKRSSFEDVVFKHGFRSYVSVPLVNHGRTMGHLTFLSKVKGNYTKKELHLLQDVADIVAIAVANALAYEEIKKLKEQLQLENRALQEEIVQRSIYEEIVGSSDSLQRVIAAIEKVAPTTSTVLITGETGTGKELLVAHAIHRRSPRANRALIKVNLAAVPTELIASELFGHEKGAFTGAMQQRIGRFEAANGGTIFLDEIGELSPEMQVALLRVLQEREFQRVGGNKTIEANVRVIAATNKDLQHEVEVGRFRMNLFYRLNVFPIQVPPLRERPDDIPILVDYFATRLGARMGKNITRVDKQSLETMQHYSWPGNIRELQNVIERGVILAEGEVLRLESGMLLREPTVMTASMPMLADGGSDRKSQIELVLRETRGKVYGPDGAAARLGLPASTLESRIRALKINKHQFK